MKCIKRSLAAAMAVLLMVPSQMVWAAPMPEGQVNDGTSAEKKKSESSLVKTATASSADEEVHNGWKEITATPSSASWKPKEEIRFNTGNAEVSVVSREDFFEHDLGDVYFEKDGSYTIQIPEDNPFFPYEVQFTYDGTVTEEWFMTPEDSVRVGGHIFYVSAYFDNTVVTQMSLKVAGDTVIVYPEEKEFTDGGAGIMPMSLLPLEEKYLTVDLTGYTPAELTMVEIDSLFTGEDSLQDGDHVMWTEMYEDDYTISAVGDTFDTSVRTFDGSGGLWEMIVGDDHQLAANNTRYLIDCKMTRSENWLTPVLYQQNEEGVRTEIPISESQYEDYDIDSRYLWAEIDSKNMEGVEDFYVGLRVNTDSFAKKQYDSLKAFEGYYTSAEEAEAGTDITGRIFAEAMDQKDAGYQMKRYEYPSITLVAYKDGKAIGCLPMDLEIYSVSIGVPTLSMNLYAQGEDGRTNVNYGWSSHTSNGWTERVVRLRPGYPADGTYYLSFTYRRDGETINDEITAAYIGRYDSIAAAQAAGAKDVKDVLFLDGSADGGGYGANFSSPVSVVIFAGEDGTEGQRIYKYSITAEETPIELSGNTLVRFNGLRDSEGRYINCYVVDVEEDSYGDYNYLTILVEEDTDLTQLAPTFYLTEETMNLYAEGSSTPEVSGESVHDFFNGPVQYSVSAEDREHSKNYWLQIIKPETGASTLYVNSFADEDAETKTEEGAVHSKREVFIDGLHNYEHDILLINQGTEAIADLSAELVSDSVELDGYWTLNGGQALSGFTTVSRTESYGELPNLAKIRLKAKEGAEGQDASGTLTIKSGETVLAVLTLSGAVGDPTITTKDIPEAVKYVPYGTMIQNSNKYSENMVSYSLTKGELPGGMELRPNGEIYGVPTETGEFEFTVRMENSISDFRDSTATFTLIVKENTDPNVDGSTDQGYEVTQRIPDIYLSSTEAHTFVSEGVYNEFVYLFLDGVQLEEGVDFDSESGSTRITIRSQTLKASNQVGTHTLGVEFRTEGDNVLKRAAQNYRVIGGGSDSGNSGSSSNNSSDSGSSSGASSSSRRPIETENVGFTDSSWNWDGIGWRCLDAGGNALADGWHQLPYNGAMEWYYFNEHGYMATGWVTVEGKTYYLNPNADGSQGKMVTGWHYLDDVWYYFNEVSDGTRGAMLTAGWYYLPYMGSTDWYYFDEAGHMLTGWINVNGARYYLNPKADGTRGKMFTGWQQIDGKWYYFYETPDGTQGAMAANTWINGHYVNGTGVRVD